MNNRLPFLAIASLFLVLGSFLSSGCEEYMDKFAKLTIRVIPDTLGPGEEVFVTGDHVYLGNWNPKKVRLEKQPDGSWQRTFTMEKQEYLTFKFTKGSWGTEAVSKDGIIPRDHEFYLEGDTTLTYKVESWKDLIFKAEGEIEGNVLYYSSSQDDVEGLNGRDYIVWLPPDYYETAESERYPVLYVQDGQNLFDPYSAYSGNEWRLDEISDSLIREGIVKPYIMVAIYNTEARSAEYGGGPETRLYMKWMIEQLKPFIDTTFRTLPDPENTAVMGASMGGLISFMLAWERPDVFGNAACLSPAFKIEAIDYVQKVKADKKAKRKIRLYIDNGTEGLEGELQPGIDDMMAELQKRQYDFLWYKASGAEHNEKAWSTRVWRPLEFFFGK